MKDNLGRATITDNEGMGKVSHPARTSCNCANFLTITEESITK